jgi:membrane protein DedA with SNARE-associated domain
VNRYGKYFLMPPAKIEMASNWVRRYGNVGIFIARLLPVVRHLISIPAGILKMPFGQFSLYTIVGAGLWCFVLSWFGAKVLGDQPQLLQSPEAMVSAMKAKLGWFVGAIVAFALLYLAMVWFRSRRTAAGPADGPRV